jgi:hypothetical protein
MEQKRRGRPRKTANVINSGESSFNSKEAIEEAIDNTSFEFYNPMTSETTEVNTYNPLGETPISRDYATPKIQEGIVVDLEEPSFQQKSYEQIQKDQNGGVAPGPGRGNPMPSQAVANDPMMNPNPAMNQLDDAEKRVASEHMVDAVLDMYDTLKGLGANLAKIKEQRVLDLVDNGRIDPNRRIPVDEFGNSVSPLEFIRSYNEQLPQAVKPDPNFRKRVRPPMIRIFSKRGWGMTDEQLVAFAFLKDLGVTGASLYAMRKGVSDVLARLEEEHTGEPRRGTPPPRPQQQAAATPPPPPPAPDNAFISPEIEEITDEEIQYQERMQEFMRQREENLRKAQEEQDKGTTKMKIQFEDNPLRDTTRREPQTPIVEEYFTKGEIITPQSNVRAESTTTSTEE